MADLGGNRPIIIKRKRIIEQTGSHGGAWKVAYADFVTAMMAFFLLMWLMNATTEKQRKGLSDYFSPTVQVSRVSGGGKDVLSGDSMAMDATLAHAGIGGIIRSEDGTLGQDGDDSEMNEMRRVKEALLGRGGESETMRSLLRHVVTRVTDEGLVIELFDVEGVPLFDAGAASPRPVMIALTQLIAETLGITRNNIAVNGHVRQQTVMIRGRSTWDLSIERAQKTRELLESSGLAAPRMNRVTGHADRRPAISDPSLSRNNRIEIILLRKDR